MSATNLRQQGYSVVFDEGNQEILFSGSIRPRRSRELDEVIHLLDTAARSVAGTLFLNFKRLAQLNNTAFKRLSAFVQSTVQSRPDLTLKLITTSVVAWESYKFKYLEDLAPNVVVEQYDKDFYPGQSVLENAEIIPVLRTQTKMTWRHERQLLRKHGLKKRMHIADICCGIGDFAVLVRKEFQPASITAVDHSKGSLDYARQVAKEFGITDIAYQYGDATSLLIPDNQFDFVTCRHSLQVFNQPDLILKELFRICKPEGTVYLTNEKKSHCYGEPRGESIEWTYREAVRLLKHFDMDVEIGPKQYRLMLEAGFEKVQMETFEITSLDGEPQEFSDVIQSWEDCYAGNLAVRRGDSPDWIARFRQGFQDHIYAVERGFAGWPIWVASGRKPAAP